MSRQGKKYGASSSCSMVKCASGDNTVASGTTLRQSRKSCRPAPLGNTSNSCLPSDPRDPKPSRIRSLRSVRQVDADSSRISKDNALGWKVGSTNVVEGWEDQLHGLVVHHAANRGISHSAPHCVDWVYVLLNIGVRTTSTPTEAAHAHTCRIRHSSEKHSCCCSSATPGESSENRCRPPRSQEEKKLVGILPDPGVHAVGVPRLSLARPMQHSLRHQLRHRQPFPPPQTIKVPRPVQRDRLRRRTRHCCQQQWSLGPSCPQRPNPIVLADELPNRVRVAELVPPIGVHDEDTRVVGVAGKHSGPVDLWQSS
mmetsp:Transcript_97015/g.259197  ORF Transcript_97015/g.259197 Transcript_97015/m.259197 type:complete len:312 (-) Transcript_97015:2394-3329(-)